MEWTDQAYILGVQKHGEGSAIVELLTRGQGRHKGLVRGASGARVRGVLQQGNAVHATWRARLADHLGTLKLELDAAHAAAIMGSSDAVLALSSLCAVASLALPEREPHPEIYSATGRLIELMGSDEASPALIAASLLKWELALLSALGYGLDLSSCAVSGQDHDLGYVSPRSARAVSRAGAGAYASRLLPLPEFMIAAGASPSMQELLDGARLTGFFLERHVLNPLNRRLPPARTRYIEHLTAPTPTSGSD